VEFEGAGTEKNIFELFNLFCSTQDNLFPRNFVNILNSLSSGPEDLQGEHAILIRQCFSARTKKGACCSRTGAAETIGGASYGTG
jgi:hypothetical protein